jgi:hypothetical protein
VGGEHRCRRLIIARSGAIGRQRRAGPRDAAGRNTRSGSGHGEELEPARGVSGRTWAVLPSTPDSPSELDPMELLRAVGEAIGRSVTAGHWPRQGPTDEHLTEIAHNLSRARHLVEPHGPPFPASGPGNTARHPRSSRSGDAHLVCGSTRDRCRTTHDPKDLREHFEIDYPTVPGRERRRW